MKILFVNPASGIASEYPSQLGGTEFQVHGLSTRMAKHGHHLHAAGRFEGMREKERIDEGVHLINIQIPRIRGNTVLDPGYLLLYSKYVCKVINDIEPDVVSLNDRFSAYYPSKMNVPKTFTLHNPEALEFYRDFAISCNYLNKVFFNVKKMLDFRVMNRSDTIVALTDSVAGFVHKKGFKNVVVIPNGVSPEQYSNSGDGNFVMFAGRLNKVKGISFLVEAFSQVAKEFNTKLVIIGSGPEEHRLKSLARSLNLGNSVQFIPALNHNDLLNYLSKCSLFVLPSIFETMGITMLEAMASGKPVVASNIAGPNEVISHGRNGLLFERGNSIDLKSQIEEVLTNPEMRRRLGREARRTIVERFAFETTSRQLEGVFDRIVK
jgi:glycosyltransferase involved in cell wall biosynthesis